MRNLAPVPLGKLLILLSVVLLVIHGLSTIYLGVDLRNLLWFGVVGLVVFAMFLFFAGLFVEDYSFRSWIH
ncbi:MAG: hypothetical protein KAW09_09695 [Thermoplasmata archaeon]|nr:hypothetical protein [Thermoplasmata archaeon]